MQIWSLTPFSADQDKARDILKYSHPEGRRIERFYQVGWNENLGNLHCNETFCRVDRILRPGK